VSTIKVDLMKYQGYEAIKMTDDLSRTDFLSIGKSGTFQKQIVFIPSEIDNIFNLAFGDITENGMFDDNSVSDNGDRNRILATIATAVEKYTKRYPERVVYFTGSTKARTRLYRMAIGLNLEELSLTYEIYAQVDWEDQLVKFEKNMEISAFVIKRKVR
jgi:hypothetical protein